MTYSLDARRLALRILSQTGSYYIAAKLCNISSSTLHRWASNTSHIIKKQCRKRRKLTDDVLCRIRQILRDSNGVTTITRIQQYLQRQHVRLCRPTISDALRSLCGVSRKRTSKRFGGRRDPEVDKTTINEFETRMIDRFSDKHLVVALLGAKSAAGIYTSNEQQRER